MICQFNDLKNKYYCKNPYKILIKIVYRNTNTGFKLGRQLNSFIENCFKTSNCYNSIVIQKKKSIKNILAIINSFYIRMNQYFLFRNVPLILNSCLNYFTYPLPKAESGSSNSSSGTCLAIHAVKVLLFGPGKAL